MPLDLQALHAIALPDRAERLELRAALLYALSIGHGAADLAAVYEGAGLRLAPTLPLVLGDPGPWWDKAALGLPPGGPLHGEQALWLHAPVPLDMPLLSSNRVVGWRPLRGGHGLMTVERQTRRADTGALLATSRAGLIWRDVGQGEAWACPDCVLPPLPESAPSDRAPDVAVACAIPAEAALLYRLNGDMNPLHVDPAAARAAGFDRPILHGLATLGHVMTALGRVWGDAVPGALAVRFAAPVYPGDRLAISAWRDGAALRFSADVAGRAVLSQGRAHLSFSPAP
ncbi:3-alpha,7-alpha,12-alpha-trihydroxy-5-beta-cholest-24-enoyl-CoA hydratase [Novosphingobium sp. FSY-8]|uniref:3-alpha,7-alpha, 12-alpha-trihydroxy-5-beta-cholest-24-enoyl-CoA hydratase n=1 Tax=Novosphingobium ovatum TaxID=1908523 RepID=A0ABW9XB95_9SPHN|nr:MaoC/PaaZ C-terminal domain-containing protein [Novosphingobium ovatum]NBC35760.1 3-alpha,7-alpha,12-alpha-trihydroxy-5-beta-cholest-24-enoyl-CoA hydratase [Novosphingobium ovatum]